MKHSVIRRTLLTSALFAGIAGAGIAIWRTRVTSVNVG